MSVESPTAVIDAMYTETLNNNWSQVDVLASTLPNQSPLKRREMIEYLLSISNITGLRPSYNDVLATCLAWSIDAGLDNPTLCKRILDKYSVCPTVWERDWATPSSKLWWAVSTQQIANHAGLETGVRDQAGTLRDRLIDAAVAETLNYCLQDDLKGWIKTTSRLQEQYPYARERFKLCAIKDNLVFLLDVTHEHNLKKLGLVRRAPFSTNALAVERYRASLSV
ncbi:hypothetical protein M1523_03600 [Patescibacteria group bacterium]|nr:hypothetical protein [Patescibacteria group bacterium]MCL5091609.1 hypothetical protein [Patescibacteria group bacterium]